MEYAEFCELIERSRDADPHRHCDGLERRLSEAPIERVEGFHRCLVGVLDWLDTPDLEIAAALVLGGVDAAQFAAFRARLILAGREVWEAAAVDPSALVELPHDAWSSCVRLLELAPEMYAQRTGQRLDARTLADIDRERRAPPAEGDLEAFSRRYPRLWRRFPWELGRAGLHRERRTLGADFIAPEIHRSHQAMRKVSLATASIGTLGAVALVASGAWPLALVFVLATALGLVLAVARAYRDTRACFIAAQRRFGTGEPLVGTVRYRVVRLTAFAATGRSWRPELTRGLDLLQREARRYGEQLELVEDGAPLVLTACGAATLRRAVDRAAARIEHVRDDLARRDGPSVVIVVAEAGDTAFARSGLRAACVSAGQGPGAFAHEILHLFGACDLYTTTRLDRFRHQATRRLARDLFADDFGDDEISLMDDDDHPEARVDRFTARLVGWRSSSRRVRKAD